jgi:hypothetical protein
MIADSDLAQQRIKLTLAVSLPVLHSPSPLYPSLSPHIRVSEFNFSLRPF